MENGILSVPPPVHGTAELEGGIKVRHVESTADVLDGFVLFEQESFDYAHLMEKYGVFCDFLVDESGRIAIYTEGGEGDLYGFLSEFVPLLEDHEKNAASSPGRMRGMGDFMKRAGI